MAKISEELLMALESDDAMLLNSIIRMKKKEDFEALMRLLSMDPSIKNLHRTKAIYALGRWGDPGSAKMIGQVIADLDEVGRVTAIDSLGKIGTKEATDYILKFKNDPSTHVRKYVVHSLGKFNLDESGVALEEIMKQDADSHVRSLAKKYLKKQERTNLK